MASARSWLGSPGRNRFSGSSHELPRWRTPSPMSASMIPPPIVQSTYKQSPPTRSILSESAIVEKPSISEDRQRELEADLQFLLDAQAEGLIRGLEGGHDDQSSTGSTTPTVRSVSATPLTRRRVSRRRPGLRSARKGIYSSILSLSVLKDDELAELDVRIEEDNRTLEKLDNWEGKRHRLQEASQNMDTSEDTIRVQRLKQEADAIQSNINAMELELASMKTRQRQILKQAAAVENSVNAKVASYSSSLRLLEEDISKFLSLKPSNMQTTSQNGKQSLWDLPPRRRNLDMAREFWSQERELSAQQRKQYEHEKSALIQGASLWKDAVTEISEFEKRLKTEISSLRPSSPDSQSAWEDQPGTESTNRLKELIGQLDGVMESLEHKYHTAEENGWRLLIAAIGAELDALRRGKDILLGVLGVSVEEPTSAGGESDVMNTTTSTDEIHELDKSFQTARLIASSDAGDDHDEPDPELLFSRQDTDTE